MEEPLVHQGDDALFAAAPSIDGAADDTDLLISIAAIDEKYAGKLQLQEVLVSSFLSTTPHIHTNTNIHRDEPSSSNIHRDEPSNTNIHRDEPSSSNIHRDEPSSSNIHRDEPSNTNIHFHQVDQTSNIHRDEPSNTNIHFHQVDQSMVVYIDPKGKAVIESDSQSSSEYRSKTANCGICIEDKPVADLNPSSSQYRSKTANCGICMEDKPVADFFEIGECKHEFCEECVGQYVAVKVEENVASIGCPEAGCGVRMEMEMCQGILRPEVFERWGMAMCELMVEERFYCPYNDCSAMMMVDDGGEVIRASECPHCNRLFCAQCRVAWHGEIKCSDFQALGEGEREQEDLLLRNVAKNCKWQRCPKCRYYVERIDGCMFIKCRCGHGFCYSCASPMGDDHYCAKCRR